MSHKFTLKWLLAIALLAALTAISHAQISGELNLSGLGGKPEANAGPQTKEISATGIGITLESAEKQALASAIRQAVGAYIDSKTLVANEEVIEDRILAVSNAFVEKYEPLGEPKKTTDGLFQITILATVKTNQVVQALKENNILTGDVAGHNIYAEASTKAMNAQDAVAMLQAKFPELIKSCLTITPLDKNRNPMVVAGPDGKSTPSTEPALRDVDPTKGEVTLTWLLEIGVDKKYYKETLFPTVKECMEAIAGVPAEPAVARLHRNPDRSIVTLCPNGSSLSLFNKMPILIYSISKNFDKCDYFEYKQPKNNLLLEYKTESLLSKPEFCSISLEVLDSNDEIISSSSKPVWQPFNFRIRNRQYQFASLSCLEYDSYFWEPTISKFELKMPIATAKEIRRAKISFEVKQPVFSLVSNSK